MAAGDSNENNTLSPVFACRAVLMLKAPVKGFVKTRLAKTIGEEKALELYRWMGSKTVKAIPKDWEIEVRFIPAHREGQVRSWLQREGDYFPQGEGDLGLRMSEVFSNRKSATSTCYLFLGGDCPAITTELLTMASRCLNDNDIVVGPATDGGYYLIGMKRPRPELFQNIPWGEGDVLQRTLEKAENQRLSVAMLPELCDVDDWESLLSQKRFFCQDLWQELALDS